MDADQVRLAVKRLGEISQALRGLKAEEDILREQLRPFADALFKPNETGLKRSGGIQVKRGLQATKLRVDDVDAALEWAMNCGEDVLASAPISKTKLDKIGVTYSDDRVSWEGEQIPGLVVERTYSVSYAPDRT